MAKDRKKPVSPSSQPAPGAVAVQVDAMLRRLGWDREVPAQLATARQLAAEAAEQPGRVDEVIAGAQALGIDLSRASARDFAAIGELLAQRAKARAAKAPAAPVAPVPTVPAASPANEPAARAPDLAIAVTDRAQGRLEAVARRHGIDLSTPQGLEKANRLALPPAKRPVTHNPFAALARHGAA